MHMEKCRKNEWCVKAHGEEEKQTNKSSETCKEKYREGKKLRH